MRGMARQNCVSERHGQQAARGAPFGGAAMKYMIIQRASLEPHL